MGVGAGGDGEERRRQPRVEYFGDGVAMIGKNRIPCQGRDLSRGGVAIRGRWAAYPGQSVTIELGVEGERVNVFGSVAWARPDGEAFVWGVRFTAVHARCRRCIEAYVGARLEGARDQPLPAPDLSIEPSRLPTSEMVLDASMDEERMPTIDSPMFAVGLEDDGLLEFEEMPTLVFSRRSKELRREGVVRRRKPRRPEPEAWPSFDAAPSQPAYDTAPPPAPAPHLGVPMPVVTTSTVPVDVGPPMQPATDGWGQGPSAFGRAPSGRPSVDVSGFSVPIPPALDEPPGGTEVAEVAEHRPFAPHEPMLGPGPVPGPVAAPPLSASRRTWPVLPPSGPTAVPVAAGPPAMPPTTVLAGGMNPPLPGAAPGSAPQPPAMAPSFDNLEPLDLQQQRRRRVEDILAAGRKRRPPEEPPEAKTMIEPPKPKASPVVARPERVPSGPQQPVDFSAEVRALYEQALRQLD
jgi:hypothetical protein